MMSQQARITFSGVVLGIVFVIGVLASTLYTFHVRGQAEACLDSIKQIQVGTSTSQGVDKSMEPFRPFQTIGTVIFAGKSCTTYSYLIRNSGTHLLGILHTAALGATVTFRDGIVIKKSVYFFRGPFYQVTSTETIRGVSRDQSLDQKPLGVDVWETDPLVKLDVFLDTRASEVDRNSAFDYNLGCFTSFTDCATVYRILPGAKRLETK